MNYKMHYNKLVVRAQQRIITGYYERHHIIPKCMGGSDTEDNLIYLTAEEHYVAHQLLIKIYPENHKLIYAANMMCVSDNNQKRNNKEYSWLKQRRSKLMAEKMQGNDYAKGSIRTDEFKHNLSNLLKGIKQGPMSDDAKKNISISQKLRFESMTPEERKKSPRTQQHTDNWRAAMLRRKELK